MCGIVGYIGARNVPSVLLGSLWRLEYRGYDSSGIAVISNSELIIRKVPGKLSELEVAIVELDRLQNDVESAQEAYQNFLREAETARRETGRRGRE